MCGLSGVRAPVQRACWAVGRAELLGGKVSCCLWAAHSALPAGAQQDMRSIPASVLAYFKGPWPQIFLGTTPLPRLVEESR